MGRTMSATAKFRGYMKKFWLAGLVLATAIAMAPAGRATTFTVTLTAYSSNGWLTGSGTLIGSALGNGGFDITSGSMTFDGMSASVIVNPYSSEAAYVDLSTGGTLSSIEPPANDNWFAYDDILTPGTAPYLDYYGILFELSDGGVLEFWSVGDLLYWNEYSGAGWAVGTTVPQIVAGAPANVDILSISPEPSTLLLLGTGLFMLAGFLYRTARKAAVKAA